MAQYSLPEIHAAYSAKILVSQDEDVYRILDERLKSIMKNVELKSDSRFLGKYFSSLDVLVISHVEVDPTNKLAEYEGSYESLYISGETEKIVRNITTSYPQGFVKEKVPAVLAHELTHRWLKKNTDVGELLLEISRKKNIEEKSLTDREKEFAAIDEIFASYTDYLTMKEISTKFWEKDAHEILEEAFSNNFRGYPASELISWGIKHLHRKMKEFESRGEAGGELDYLRKLAAQILNKSLDREEPFMVFVRVLMTSEEKEKINEITEIYQKDLKTVLQHLKQFESELLEKGYKKEVQSLERHTSWETLVELEKNLFTDLIRENIKNKEDPGQITKSIDSAVEREIKQLERYRSLLNNLDLSFGVQSREKEIEEGLEAVIKKLRETRKM